MIQVKNKILLGVVIILSIVTMIVIEVKEKLDHSFFEPEKEPTINIKTPNDTIENIDLEEYLIGVLAAEMPASFHEEALKAQAVASRSYALYKMNHNTGNSYDILTNVTNQSYITKEEMKEKWGKDYEFYLNKITNAVKDTQKEVMYYDNQVIEAFYFAMSNGTTEDAQSVFSENLPYIKSVESSWDNETLKNFIVKQSFTKQKFCELLNLISCNTINIDNINRSNTGRVNKITINNQEFLGTEIRSKLNLRSTDFNMEIEQENINITTKGYGHGVGMSQYGANGMAKEGYTYKEILNYYYKDITINKMV